MTVRRRARLLAGALGACLLVMFAPSATWAAPVPCRPDSTLTDSFGNVFHLRVCDDAVKVEDASSGTGKRVRIVFDGTTAAHRYSYSSDGTAWAGTLSASSGNALHTTTNGLRAYRWLRGTSGTATEPTRLVVSMAPIPDQWGGTTKYAPPAPEPTSPPPTTEPPPDPEPTSPPTTQPPPPDPEPTSPPPTTPPPPDPEPTSPPTTQPPPPPDPEPTSPPTTDPGPGPTDPPPVDPEPEPDPEPAPVPEGTVVVQLSEDDRLLVSSIGGGVMLMLTASTVTGLVRRR